MKQLSTDKDWEELLERSMERPVAVLKHSAACGISAHAFEKIREAEEKGILPEPVYVVIIQESRSLSNRISRDLEITHQSPQIIVIKGKKGVYDASHFGIDSEKISAFLS